MTREGARIDTGDRRDPVIAQEPGELAGVLQNGGRGIGDDEGSEPRPARLVVCHESAVVADERVGHDDDLARVGGVGADLLVAGLARVHDEIATRRDRGAEGDAREDRAVLQCQQRRSQIADPRIDHRARTDGGRGDHSTASPITNDPPAVSAWWAWIGADIEPPSPASQDRYAGLTGPAIQGRGQGTTGPGRRVGPG